MRTLRLLTVSACLHRRLGSVCSFVVEVHGGRGVQPLRRPHPVRDVAIAIVQLVEDGVVIGTSSRVIRDPLGPSALRRGPLCRSPGCQARSAPAPTRAAVGGGGLSRHGRRRSQAPAPRVSIQRGPMAYIGSSMMRPCGKSQRAVGRMRLGSSVGRASGSPANWHGAVTFAAKRIACKRCEGVVIVSGVNNQTTDNRLNVSVNNSDTNRATEVVTIPESVGRGHTVAMPMVLAGPSSLSTKFVVMAASAVGLNG